MRTARFSDSGGMHLPKESTPLRITRPKDHTPPVNRMAHRQV